MYPRVHADITDVAAIEHAGGVLLTETILATGLDRALSGALRPWRKPFAVHDPGKIVGDLAVALALGGDAMSDLATVRAEPGVYGRVASDPTVSRLITALAEDADKVVAAISAARAAARAVAWALAGQHAPDAAVTPDRPVVIDLDATLIASLCARSPAPTAARATRAALPFRGCQMVCVRGAYHLEGEHHGDHGSQSGARGASSASEGAC
ncbi:transposase [Microbacterium sp.]|uniref:transposase n=1 Tax=Microbacterium sp. TaxID=51671 RepID=UPI003C73B206